MFRAGAASISIDPPLGLPMVGVVRRDWVAAGRTGPLEATALAFESGAERVVVCGVDTLAIQSPEIDHLRQRIAEATAASLPGVLVNFSHTHHAPPGGRTVYGSFGERDVEPDAATLAYVELLHDRVIEVCRAACESLEPAWVRWGLGFADQSVNRRERDPDGMVRRLGWHVEGMLDQSVPVLQAVRADETAIGTLVAYGCHSVTTSVDAPGYSPDYPGPLRDGVRRWTGGECVFFLAAAGNVMPRVSFDERNEEMRRMGERIALEALHALDPSPTWPAELRHSEGFRSGSPVAAYRWRREERPAPALAATERHVDFPLQELPSLEEIAELRRRSEAEVATARERGASESEIRPLRFHGLNWARRVESELASGSPHTAVRGTIGAVRIGDGVIATGPGETFTEIGLAVKERSPAAVTLYCGYTNGCISYFPIASEYPLGGYEPTYGNKTYGLPAQVAPSCDRLLVETAVAASRDLFPDAPAIADGDWRATGRLPEPPVRRPIHRPADPPTDS